MAGGTEFTVIIKGQRGFSGLDQLFNRVVAVLVLCFPPVIKEGGQDPTVGGHQGVLDFRDVDGMTAFEAASLFYYS